MIPEVRSAVGLAAFLAMAAACGGGCGSSSSTGNAGGEGGSPAEGGAGGAAAGREGSSGAGGRPDRGGEGGDDVNGGGAGGGAGAGDAQAGAGGAGGAVAGGAGGQMLAGRGGSAGAGGTMQPPLDDTNALFSGKEQTTILTKLVPGDDEPGYMSLNNGIRPGVSMEIPIEAVEVDDPALPAGTKYALYANTPNPGAINLIWSINFRADGGNGGKRADWQGFDVTGFAGLEYFIKTSHLKGYNLTAYSGTEGNKHAQKKISSDEWRRVRVHFEDDITLGRGPLDLSSLGRIDFILSVENDNPPLGWWMTGIRLLTDEQFAVE